MKRFVYIVLLAAVLGIYLPGARAYVSENWRSDSVISVRDFRQIDAELRHQKTLVPGVESQWIICRNDPVNMIDPDGAWARKVYSYNKEWVTQELGKMYKELWSCHNVG